MRSVTWIVVCAMCCLFGFVAYTVNPGLARGGLVGTKRLPAGCPKRPTKRAKTRYTIVKKITLGRASPHVRLNNSCTIVWSGNPTNRISSLPFQTFPSLKRFAFSPEINDKGQVVWQGLVGGGNHEVFFKSQRLTKYPGHDNSPKINNKGEIIWIRGGSIYSNEKGRIVKDNVAFIAMNNLSEIVYRRNAGQASTIVSTKRGVLGKGDWPSINDHGEVVWMKLSKPPYQIVSSKRGVLATGNFPRINNHGAVIYRRGVKLGGTLFTKAFVKEHGVEYPIVINKGTHIHSFDLNDRGMVVVSTYEKGAYAIYLLYPPKLTPLVTVKRKR